jgi:hypothetical protein
MSETSDDVVWLRMADRLRTWAEGNLDEEERAVLRRVVEGGLERMTEVEGFSATDPDIKLCTWSPPKDTIKLCSAPSPRPRPPRRG